MTNLIIELSKYFMIICIAFYTLHGFIVFRYSKHEDQKGFFIMQNIFMAMIHACGYAVLFLESRDSSMIIFYAVTEVTIIAFIALYRVIYPLSHPLIINNMCMLLSVSLIILARLSYSKCQKQFVIAGAGMILSLILPFFVKFTRAVFTHLTWIYALIGVGILTIVFILGSVTYGSKLSFTLSGITFQPSEAVKLLFVFFVAGMFANSVSMKQIVITSFLAMLHIGVLVLSKDLGSALIFFVTYVMMLYVTGKNLLYLLAGFLCFAVGAPVGYHMFSHVRTRVTAWLEPFSYIDGQGYQITQSLFAIGTGGWFGMGLTQGSPDKIPVVEADFIFSAISEELGCIFGLCIILICISNFLLFMNIAIKIKDEFYKLVALGMAVIYGFQMFLTIGGVTKFIPLTGVTLPLVSYGGTSVLVTLIMFSIIQGIYIRREKSAVKVIRENRKPAAKVKKFKDNDFELIE